MWIPLSNNSSSQQQVRKINILFDLIYLMHTLALLSFTWFTIFILHSPMNLLDGFMLDVFNILYYKLDFILIPNESRNLFHFQSSIEAIIKHASLQWKNFSLLFILIKIKLAIQRKRKILSRKKVFFHFNLILTWLNWITSSHNKIFRKFYEFFK